MTDINPWLVIAVLALAFALACRAARKNIERAHAAGLGAGKPGKTRPPGRPTIDKHPLI